VQHIQDYVSSLGFPEETHELSAPSSLMPYRLSEPSLSLQESGLAGKVLLHCKER
jgi:hypothetical protein